MVLSTVFDWGTEEDDADMVPAYGWKAGTSMAAPQVVGVAALVKSVNPDATPGEVRQHLEETARYLDNPTYHGEGHLDTRRAVWERIWDHHHGHGQRRMSTDMVTMMTTEHESQRRHEHDHGNGSQGHDD